MFENDRLSPVEIQLGNRRVGDTWSLEYPGRSSQNMTEHINFLSSSLGGTENSFSLGCRVTHSLAALLVRNSCTMPNSYQDN